MSRASRVTALIALGGLAAGCGADRLTGPTALGGGVWRLQSLQRANASAIVIDRPERYTAEFADASRLSVRADCNTCNGVYETAGASLQLRPLACTRAFCGDTSLDQQYLAILAGAASHEVRDGMLRISSSQGVLRYAR